MQLADLSAGLQLGRVVSELVVCLGSYTLLVGAIRKEVPDPGKVVPEGGMG